MPNLTLRHAEARLQYNLHSGHPVDDGWTLASDGVLLWPPSEGEDGLDPEGLASRESYLGARDGGWKCGS